MNKRVSKFLRSKAIDKDGNTDKLALKILKKAWRDTPWNKRKFW